MANIFSYQTTENTRKVIVKITGQFDGTYNENNENKIMANSFINALNTDNDLLINGGTQKPFYNITIDKIWYSSNTSGPIELFWSGSDNPTICFINNNNNYNKMGSWTSINNNAINPNGNIGIKTYNMSANNFYTIILELHKDLNYYNSGFIQDSGAFNYMYYVYALEDNGYLVTENDIFINT